MFVASTPRLIHVCDFLPSTNQSFVFFISSAFGLDKDLQPSSTNQTFVFFTPSAFGLDKDLQAASGGSPLTSALNLRCGVNHSHCGHLQRSLSQGDTVQVGLAWRRGPNRDLCVPVKATPQLELHATGGIGLHGTDSRLR